MLQGLPLPSLVEDAEKLLAESEELPSTVMTSLASDVGWSESSAREAWSRLARSSAAYPSDIPFSVGIQDVPRFPACEPNGVTCCYSISRSCRLLNANRATHGAYFGSDCRYQNRTKPKTKPKIYGSIDQPTYFDDLPQA
jgi:hypothetical protein